MEQVPFFTREAIAVDGLEERAREMEPGAVVSFQGVVRPDRTDRGPVVALDFEAYERMGEEEMALILKEVRDRWPGTQILCQHRLGRVPVGETSLFLVVSSPEPAEAFQSCHFALDQLRARVPLWKKDIFGDGGARWSFQHREALLISDSVLTFPPS